MILEVILIGFFVLSLGALNLTGVGKDSTLDQRFLHAIGHKASTPPFFFSAAWRRIVGVMLLVIGAVIVVAGVLSKP